MNEQFKLKDGRIVSIKRININDYERNNNYEFVHSWISKISKFLARDFDPRMVKEDKESLYNSLANKEANFTIGAIHDDKIIASSSLIINYLNEKLKHVGHWGIIIHPDFQNQGLGTKLLVMIEKIAKEKGLVRLEAELLEGNEIAKVLYIQKLNYTIEGRSKYKVKLRDGIYLDSILIGKIIDESLKQH